MLDWTRGGTNHGYALVWYPEYPRAWSTGYVYAHVVIAELVAGRYVQRGEEVHHLDRDRSNNAPMNLVILGGDAHRRIHARRVPHVTLICAYCGGSFERLARQWRRRRDRATYCSHACKAKAPRAA